MQLQSLSGYNFKAILCDNLISLSLLLSLKQTITIVF